LAPGVLLLVYLGWRESPPRAVRVLATACTFVAASATWLAAGAMWAVWSRAGSAWLERVAAGQAADDLLGTALERWSHGWTTLVAAAATLAVILAVVWERRSRGSPEGHGTTFALLLAGAGVGLVLAPELVYLQDRFVNRMNTVFKLYYLAWLLLGVAGSFGIARAWRQRGGARLASIGALAILAAGFIHAPAAVWSKTRGFSATMPTLDSLAYLEQHAPGELDAIRWVRANTRPQAVVVQAEGNSYAPDHDRISAATGRPTLLGWIGHELQWRGGAFESMAAGRRRALGSIYNPTSSDELQRLLARWQVDFVVLGPVERERYSVTPDHEAHIARAMELAFESHEVRLYERRLR
jgi:uncharacterized membrane protein